MKKLSLLFLFVLALSIVLGFKDKKGKLEQEVYTKKGLTLTFINQDPELDEYVRARMIKTFFDLYPVLMKQYNHKAIHEVTFLVDTAYTGVAESWGNNARYSSKWLKSFPSDIDVVTHEIMHIVQAYPADAGPWWITEGIADYGRYKYGVNNQEAGWSLTEYRPGQSYEDGYRITARFFAWIEKNVKPGFVKKLDNAMRTKTYTPETWEQLTGKSLHELWDDYAKHSGNPVEEYKYKAQNR